MSSWSAGLRVAVLLLVLYVAYAEATSPSQFAQKHKTKAVGHHTKAAVHHKAAHPQHKSKSPARKTKKSARKPAARRSNGKRKATATKKKAAVHRKPKSHASSGKKKKPVHKKRHRRFKALLSKLNRIQRRRFFVVMRKGGAVTKLVHRHKINRFVHKLSNKQQKQVKTGRARARAAIRKQREAYARKLGKLSPQAQALFKKLDTIVNDESITKTAEQKKVKAAVKKAPKSVLHELRKARINLPGVVIKRHRRKSKAKRGHKKKKHAAGHKKPKGKKTPTAKHPQRPGGFLGAIYGKLSKREKAAVQHIISQQNLKKRDFKKKVEAFVKKLKPGVQKVYNAAKKKHSEQRKKDAETVKSMSEEAQKLYESVLEVDRDGSITFAQTHKKIQAFVN
ncbi:hypothetical protein M3Y99_01571300 [Aphelenchoides fujianensis]|nr:hypothetical protein M3Y99_01571300 [Aphelenchoides fujianensis]